MSSIGHIYPSLEVFKFYLKTAEDRTGSDFEEAFIRRAWSGVTKFGESYRWSDGDKRLLDEILLRGSVRKEWRALLGAPDE